MITALFDDARRKELRGAIASGKQIDFAGREPKVDNTAVQDAIGSYNGTLSIGESYKIGGFHLVYNGLVAGGIAMGIKYDGGLTETKTLPEGKETVIRCARAGMRVSITPGSCEMSRMHANIVVEQMNAEGA